MADVLWCAECSTGYETMPDSEAGCTKCGGHVFTKIAPPEPEPSKPETVEAKQPEVIEAKVVGEPEPAADRVREARQLVPVTSGISPSDLAGQIQFARDMCKADIGVPPHLRGAEKVGACMAVIDIAQRANLSPYMVANLSYTVGERDKQRLAFMSQLWHALLEQSKRLDGVLKHRFEGEGNTMTCTVMGKLRGDPEVLGWTSPPIESLLPKKNAEGVRKGSPLWDRKPRVQLLYDTQRDWVRVYCPAAVAGIPIDDEPPAEIADAKPDLLERLASADRTQGHQNGGAERELAAIGAKPRAILPAEPEPSPRKRRKQTKATKVAAKPRKRASGHRAQA